MKKIQLTSIIALLFFFATLVACNSNNTNGEETMGQNEESTIPDSHNSQNSLDWPGTYEGTLPCADCEGILTTIELKNDNTFTRKQNYLGKAEGEFNESGTFNWNEDGNIVITKNSSDTFSYKVEEGRLVMLNQDGNQVTGDLAEHYILKKK